VVERVEIDIRMSENDSFNINRACSGNVIFNSITDTENLTVSQACGRNREGFGLRIMEDREEELFPLINAGASLDRIMYCMCRVSN